MEAEYKLIHFNSRYLAEPIRFIFMQANVRFEDIRLTSEEWESLKPEIPFQRLPILELKDGSRLSQSGTICKYLARQFGLSGVDEWEAAKCSEIGDNLRDMRQAWKRVFFEKDAEKKDEYKADFVNVILTQFLGTMEKNLDAKGGVFLVGNQVTWADLALATTIGFFQETIDEAIMEPYPNLMATKNFVWNLPRIRKWRKVRPTPNIKQVYQMGITV